MHSAIRLLARTASLCTAFLFAGPSMAQVLAASDYFPLLPGTSWTAQSGGAVNVCQILPLSQTANGIPAYPISCSSGITEYYTNDHRGLVWYQRTDPYLGGTGIFTPLVVLPAVFSVGQSISQSGAISSNGQHIGNYSGATVVRGIEEIATPAGQFRAVSVQMSLTFFLQGETRFLNRTLWLAQGIGPVKLSQSSDWLGNDFSLLVSSTRLPVLVASILPLSRSVRVGETATAFATVINAGPTAAANCRLGVTSTIPATFSFQATNPMTNAVVGQPNSPIDLAVGAAQSFVIALTPTSLFESTDVQLSFDCANSSPASSLTGINTLLLSSSSTAVPDVIALAATVNNDGIVNIPGTSGVGAFAVATANVGASGTISVSADTGTSSVPVVLLVCETNSSTGACLSQPAVSVTTTISTGGTPTFAVFARSAGTAIPLNAAINRIFVRFRDGTNSVRGATSVAVRTQ